MNDPTYYVMFLYAEIIDVKIWYGLISAPTDKEAKSYTRDLFRRENNIRPNTFIGARILYSSTDPAAADKFYKGFKKALSEAKADHN